MMMQLFAVSSFMRSCVVICVSIHCRLLTGNKATLQCAVASNFFDYNVCLHQLIVFLLLERSTQRVSVDRVQVAFPVTAGPPHL